MSFEDEIIRYKKDARLISLIVISPTLRVMLSANGAHQTNPLKLNKGQSILELFPVERETEIRLFYSKILSGEEITEITTSPEKGIGYETENIHKPLKSENGEIIAAITVSLKRETTEIKQDIVQNAAPKADAIPEPKTKPVEEIDTKRSPEEQKMLVLGKLLNGIIHELNTPIGALSAGTTNLDDIFKELFIFNLNIIRTLDDESYHKFETYLTKTITPTTKLDSREFRKRARETENLLTEVGHPDPYSFASKIISLNLEQELQKDNQFILSERGEKVMNLLYAINQTVSNLNSVKTAAAKATTLVGRVKQFTDPREGLQMVNLGESLHTMLAIYHNEIKYGIELTLNNTGEYILKSLRDDIFQLWGTILQAFIEMLQKKGKLSIDIQNENSKFIAIIIGTSNQEIESNPQKLGPAIEILDKLNGTHQFYSESGKIELMIRIPLAN